MSRQTKTHGRSQQAPAAKTKPPQKHKTRWAIVAGISVILLGAFCFIVADTLRYARIGKSYCARFLQEKVPDLFECNPLALLAEDSIAATCTPREIGISVKARVIWDIDKPRCRIRLTADNGFMDWRRDATDPEISNDEVEVPPDIPESAEPQT